jgi:sugar O-acyltransferase (sialic acid O-acetyltransferase NeuD family)
VTERDPAKGVVVYGGGGHGRTIIDLLRASDDLWPAYVVDDRDLDGPVLGVPVAGGPDSLARLHAEGHRLAVNAVGPIGSTDARQQVFATIADAGFSCPAVVHPRAIVEPSAVVADGCHVLAGAYVGSSVSIGFGAIVNTLAVVSHDRTIGALSHICPGALLAGEGSVGERTVIGLGATVHIGVVIGDDVLIGNSAVVKADVPSGTRVRAGGMWPPPS